MAEVVWPDDVLDNLTDIAAYIHPFDPDASIRIARALRRTGDSLASFPERGRPGPRGTRELVTVPPYIIRYRVEGELVIILSIRHGARRPLD